MRLHEEGSLSIALSTIYGLGRGESPGTVQLRTPQCWMCCPSGPVLRRVEVFHGVASVERCGKLDVPWCTLLAVEGGRLLVKSSS